MVDVVDGHGVAHLDVPRRPREPEAGEAPEQFLEGDLHLQARELLARALVDAEAEPQLPLGGRVGEVEGVRVGEAVGVAVGGDQGHRHRLTGRGHLSGQLDVLQGRPGGAGVDDGLVPHELFHGVFGERGVGQEPGQLVGVFEEGEDAQGEHVGGRLMARDEQRDPHEGHFVVGESAVREVAEQVVGGRGALAEDQPAQAAGSPPKDSRR